MRNDGIIHWSISKILYQAVCVFSQIEDIKHIEHDICSATFVIPHGWELVAMG